MVNSQKIMVLILLLGVLLSIGNPCSRCIQSAQAKKALFIPGSIKFPLSKK